ncbi:acyl-ACP thioesterase [Nocardiopsis sp. EMB25]|uniref:acyl-ACP thioesterase n=1 Tax=Nocardiopsis sp. EMB25 TaxID=2835867 RepID=UPI003FA37343
MHPYDPPSAGPFTFHARLGDNAWSRTYLASASGLESVAVTVVRAEQATDSEFRSALERLVSESSGMDSAHVCEIKDADLGGVVPWVALSRPLGPTLADYVRVRGPLTADALHSLGSALAQALFDMHSAGFPHGSLWPDGVLMTTREAVLADPGLGRAVGDTRPYAPHPSFVPHVDGSAFSGDVFAWAATLVYAASGEEGPSGLSRLPLELRGLVQACLRRSPALRPSAADLVRGLGGPAAVRPWPQRTLEAVEAVGLRQRRVLQTGTSGDVPVSGRGRRTLLLVSACVALSLVAGVGAVWGWPRWTGDTPEEEVTAMTGMITDATCSDGSGYPVPEGEVRGGDTTVWNTAFGPGGDVLAVGTEEHGLMLWDWRDGEEVARLSDGASWRVKPFFAPVGCMVAAGVPVEYDDYAPPVTVVHTFDVPSGTTTVHFGPQSGPEGPDGLWTSVPRDALSVAFSPDGSRMALTLEARGDAAVGLLDTTSGGGTGALIEVGELNDDHERTAFFDDDRLITRTRDEIFVWDTGSGSLLNRVSNMDESDFALIPGGDELVYFDGGRLVLWDPVERTAERTVVLEGFDADGASYDFTGELTAERAAFLPDTGYSPFYELTVDPGRSRLYASRMTFDEDSGAVFRSHVWDMETGEDLIVGSEDFLFTQLSLHPDGEVLAIVTPDDRVALADPDTLEVWDPLF